MSTINVNVPEPMLSAIALRAENSGFSDVNEFVSHLVVQISERQAEVEDMAIEGLKSGPCKAWSGDEIEAIRSELKSRHGS